MNQKGSSLPLWLGPLISVTGLISYFAFSASIPVLRDSALLNLALVVVGTGLSLLGVIRAWRSKRSKWVRGLGSLGLLLAGLSGAMLSFYVFVLSYELPEPQASTLELAVLPELTLADQHGNPVAIHERRGRKLVLSFYRGHW